MMLPGEVTIGRFAEMLRTLLAVRGGDIRQQLIPEIQPVVKLAGGELELELLKGTWYFTAYVACTGQAAENSMFQLVNNDTSSLICVARVKALRVHTAGYTSHSAIPVSTAISVPLVNANVSHVDMRRRRNTSGATVAGIAGFSGTQVVAAPFSTAPSERLYYVDTQPPVRTNWYVLVPGSQLVSYIETVNVTGVITWEGYVRPATDRELSL